MSKFSNNNTTSYEATIKYSEKPDWKLIVVGDKKTPKEEYKNNCLYLSPEDQEDLNIELSDSIGWNCIQRRNMGFYRLSTRR